MRLSRNKSKEVCFRLTPLTVTNLRMLLRLRKALGLHTTINEILYLSTRHSLKRLETRARATGIDVDALRAGVDKVKAKRSGRLDTINDGPVIDEYKA